MKPCAPAEMPFTRESVIQMLGWDATPEVSPYSHMQIAEWCDRFWCQYLNVDADLDIERLLSVPRDVETQWDLYLANTYTLEEFRTKDFEVEQMPKEWFNDWLRQLAPQDPAARSLQLLDSLRSPQSASLGIQRLCASNKLPIDM